MTVGKTGPVPVGRHEMSVESVCGPDRQYLLEICWHPDGPVDRFTAADGMLAAQGLVECVAAARFFAAVTQQLVVGMGKTVAEAQAILLKLRTMGVRQEWQVASVTLGAGVRGHPENGFVGVVGFSAGGRDWIDPADSAQRFAGQVLEVAATVEYDARYYELLTGMAGRRPDQAVQMIRELGARISG